MNQATLPDYAWPRSRRDRLADLLTAKRCDECGGDMVYREYAKPHVNPTTLGGLVPKVIFGHWRCLSYGQCENAPG